MISQNGKGEEANREQGTFSDNSIIDQDIFGGTQDFYSKDAIYGDDDTSDMPDEIRAFFDLHDLSERTFKVMLKQIPENGSTSDESYIKGWKNRVPSIDYIANEWGPGSYVMIFSWKAKDSESQRSKSFMERVNISISDKYQEQYDEYQSRKRLDRQLKRKKEIERLRQNRELEEAITGSGANSESHSINEVEAGEQYIRKMAKAADMLGWKRGFDWEGMMKMIVPAMPAIIGYFNNKQQQAIARQDRMMELLFTTMQQSNNQVLEAMKGANGPQTGSEMMKEMFSMVTGAMDIKSALNGENKETVVDKIFKLVEGVAPMIVQMASIPRPQRESIPAYQAAKAYVDSDPSFQAAQNDPEILKMLVDRWDYYYGWEQTDGILEVGGLNRPESCPRLESKRFKYGDPRNEQVGSAEENDLSDNSEAKGEDERHINDM